MNPFDPTESPPEKIRVNPSETPEVDPAVLKARIAEKVREDSRERSRPTPEHTVLEIAADVERERLSELLAEMASDAAFADIKAVVTPSGRIYLFSEPHLGRNEAAEKCFVEEAKVSIVEKVRKDSMLVALTPLADLEELFPWPEQEKRLSLLTELGADERFRDIQLITGSKGDVYLHSDMHVSSNYGKIMMRAKANDADMAIAEFVRDRSRVIPAPTNLTVFNDWAFGLSQASVHAFVDKVANPAPELADIKKLVHPTTGAVYLYSEKWIHEVTAFRLMDWEEVGAARNP